MPVKVSQLLAVAASFAIVLALTPVVRALARRWGVVARPKSDRWHSKPTAMLGGVAIWAGVTLSYMDGGPKTATSDGAAGGERLVGR